MGLRHGRLHVGEPPFQPPGGGDEEGGPGELPHANHCPGVARPSLPLVGLAMRPVPYPVVPPAGSASVPQRGHGPDANPQVANLGLPGGLALPDAGPAVSAPPPRVDPVVTPQRQETSQGQDPGAQRMAAHRHTDTLPLGNHPGKTENRGTRGDSTPYQCKDGSRMGSRGPHNR